MRPDLRQIALLNLSMVFIATSGAFGRSLSIGPEAGIWWRSLIGLVAIIGYTLYTGLSWQLKGRRTQFIVLLSGLLMTIHWVAYFYALHWSSVAVAMISVFTYPAITTILEPLLLKTRLQWIHVLLGVLVLLGIYWMAPAFDLNNHTTAGILAGLVSATAYALRNILMKTQVDKINGSVLMGYQAATAVVMLLPVILIGFELPPRHDWAALAGLGLITTALGHTLLLNSFKFFSVTTASLISSIQPVYGILLGFLLLGEVPAQSAIGGGALILLSVVVEALRAGKAKQTKRANQQ